MRRRAFIRAVVAAVWAAAVASPVWAHGDHDARPLARHLEAGPYVISLWQVYPDAGDSMTPHLIVMLDDVVAVAGPPDIRVAVDSILVDVLPSTTTDNGWETTMGLDEGDVVSVTISDGAEAWDLDPVVVPPPPTSMLPMPELIYTSIFLTLGTACWVAARTARAWRRPAITPART